MNFAVLICQLMVASEGHYANVAQSSLFMEKTVFSCTRLKMKIIRGKCFYSIHLPVMLIVQFAEASNSRRQLFTHFPRQENGLMVNIPNLCCIPAAFQCRFRHCLYLHNHSLLASIFAQLITWQFIHPLNLEFCEQPLRFSILTVPIFWMFCHVKCERHNLITCHHTQSCENFQDSTDELICVDEMYDSDSSQKVSLWIRVHLTCFYFAIFFQMVISGSLWAVFFFLFKKEFLTSHILHCRRYSIQRNLCCLEDQWQTHVTTKQTEASKTIHRNSHQKESVKVWFIWNECNMGYVLDLRITLDRAVNTSFFFYCSRCFITESNTNFRNRRICRVATHKMSPVLSPCFKRNSMFSNYGRLVTLFLWCYGGIDWHEYVWITLLESRMSI